MLPLRVSPPASAASFPPVPVASSAAAPVSASLSGEAGKSAAYLQETNV